MGLPAFDTSGWTLRVGGGSVAEIGAQVEWDSLAFNRGEHGEGELSCSMGLGYSPRLPLCAALTLWQPLELWDGAHRLWKGKLRQLTPDDATNSVALIAKGPLDDAKRAEHFDAVFSICDYGLWQTDQNDDEAGQKYNVDTDSRIRVRLEDGTKVATNQGARAYLALPPWTSYMFGRLTTTWAMSNPSTGPYEARLQTRQTPNGSIVATPWTRSAPGSGSLDETFATPARVLVLRLVNTAGETNAADRQILHNNVVAYVAWDDYTEAGHPSKLSKARVDEIMCSVVGRLGLASTFVSEAIGATIDNAYWLDATTAAAVLEEAADLHSTPIVWRWDGDVFYVHPRPTVPSDRARWYVAYVDPVGSSEAACPDYGVEVAGEDLADYVALYYPVKDDADWLDGTMRRVIYPNATPASDDRVLRLNWPGEGNVTTAKATDFAQRSYNLMRAGFASGPIPVVGNAIRTVDGATVPVWWVQEDSFISVPDDPLSTAEQPHYVTGVEYASGEFTIHTGGSELTYHVAPGRRRQRRPRPLKVPKKFRNLKAAR